MRIARVRGKVRRCKLNPALSLEETHDLQYTISRSFDGIPCRPDSRLDVCTYILPCGFHGYYVTCDIILHGWRVFRPLPYSFRLERCCHYGRIGCSEGLAKGCANICCDVSHIARRTMLYWYFSTRVHAGLKCEHEHILWVKHHQ